MRRFIVVAAASSAVAFHMPAAPMARTLSRVNNQPGGPAAGKSLDYNPDKYMDEANAGNFRKLSDKLNEADIERRKIEEAAEKRANAAQYVETALPPPPPPLHILPLPTTP